ncbi:hypothetical protein [Rosistilla oblonga]|uniref:hypothetical protein n=1 Tax=Rosistilla oblonga TaxID=2527990 RepID=UPI003A974FE7
MDFIHPIRSTTTRRGISLTLLVVLACGMIGLPTYAPVPEKTGRFPCEACSCGCSSAEFCWDKCCCHSDVEKLQWAAENDVQPPEFLIARVQRAAVEAVASKVALSAKSCCCSASSGSQCEPKPQAAASATATATATVKSPTLRIVRLEDAARCRGIDSFWNVLSSVVVEIVPATFALPTPPLLFWTAIDDQFAHPLRFAPAQPYP